MKALRICSILALAGTLLILPGCGARPDSSSPPAPGAAPASGSSGAASSSVPAGPAAESAVGTAAEAGPASGTPGSPAAAPAVSVQTAPGTPAAPGTSAPESARKAPRRIGELVYAEGTVTLHRGGAAPRPADIGQVVENFDVLQTGPKSRATLELDPGRPGGAEIRLAENTAFYYESALSDEEARRTVLQLLAGSVAVKVEKLANGQFKVGTDSAVLGVRGTTFIVNTIPDGALLVTCAEGRVEVIDDTGERGYAQPGRIVSQQAGEAVREDLVALETLADFRVAWVDDGQKSLEARAPRVIAGLAGRYTEALPSFEAAYAKLRAQGPVLDAWAVAREAGGEPGFTDWIPEKKTVAPILFDCLAALFKLERPLYRLQELSALHDRGVGAGTLPDGRTTAAFFGAYRAEAPGVADKLAYVRRALLLFKWVSAGSPLGQFFGSKAESLGNGGLFLED